MPTHDIVVIGASAGGVEALVRLVRDLPPDLQASLFVVVHFPEESTSFLPQILERKGKLPARHPQNGDPIQSGNIYVAPTNQHMVLNNGHIQLLPGPRINGFRPAIDLLFHSAARSFGSRTVGVILSGMLGDGVAGLSAIKKAGGVAIVQDPEEAIFSTMPHNAIETVPVDFVLPVSEIAKTLRELADKPVVIKGVERMQDEEDREARIVADSMANFEQGKPAGTNSVITCPDCGGVLWELLDGELVHYRCHVGHAYTSESLFAEQAVALESALWTAIRSLEERASLCRRMAVRVQTRGSTISKRRFEDQADEYERKANIIRELLFNRRTVEPGEAPPEDIPHSGNSPSRPDGGLQP